MKIGRKDDMDFNKWLKKQSKPYKKLIKNNPELTKYAITRWIMQTDHQSYTIDFKDLLPEGVKIYKKDLTT